MNQFKHFITNALPKTFDCINKIQVGHEAGSTFQLECTISPQIGIIKLKILRTILQANINAMKEKHNTTQLVQGIPLIVDLFAEETEQIPGVISTVVKRLQTNGNYSLLKALYHSYGFFVKNQQFREVPINKVGCLDGVLP